MTTASIGASLTDGHPCPGAASIYVTYASTTGQQVTLNYNHNNPPLNWTGFAKTHFWIKLVANDYTGINGIQPYVQSATNYSNYKSAFTNTSTFTDGDWHEVAVDITGSDLPNVVQIGVQIQFKPAPDAGSSPAGAVTMLLDSIWNENAPTPDGGADGGDARGDAGGN